MMSARVLVVEDEVIVAKTIASQLTRLGYTVIGTASSGSAAINRAISDRPELILMDIFLKGDMDGITAASQIREQLDVPIVFLTAYADESTLQRAKMTLPLGYIVKPFNETELRVAIELALFKHQMEQELRQNREYLATLLRSISDGVIATDGDGQITFMNPAAEVLTGWREAEAFGQPSVEVLKLIDEVTEAPVANPIDRVLQEQQVVYLDDFTALIRRDGDRIPIGDSASPMWRQPDEVQGAVVVFWDVSDRRQTELLAKALEKERDVNSLKSQFISTVSHEFRNPLAVIRTATELLELRRSTMSEDQATSYLQRIKTAVRFMDQVMENVLLMGRSDADCLQLNPVPLNLEQFCRDLIDECSVSSHFSHDIVFQFEGDRTEVVMDESLLRHIFTNLLTNAIKYSPNGSSVRFNVTYSATAQVATFQIQDQGIGIPETDQSYLFQSFYRASNAGKIQGSGLGLAIVKRCVDLHQGQIAIASNMREGTTVTVTLPLATSQMLD